MATFKHTTGIMGAPNNLERAREFFAEAGNPIEGHARGMSRYRLADGSHIVCTFRGIWHTTRKASSPLQDLENTTQHHSKTLEIIDGAA